jgi:hypothetical protein
MKRAPILLLAILIALPAAADLSVGWIAREPKIAYVWESNNPTRDGWPAVGQQVKWVGHVWNLTGARQTDIAYRWTIDGQTVAEGTTALEQGDNRLELPWNWTFDRHEIALDVDTGGKVTESVERNNRLLIYSDAVAVGFWVERGFWEGIRPIIATADFRAVTFADWMQIRIRQFNTMAHLARYEETPNGVRDRWRVDEIHIVEDGALPLVPPGADVRDWGALERSWPVLYPDSRDRTVDMMWGFPTSSLEFYRSVPFLTWTMLYDSLIHELGHARTLIDVYVWRLDSRDQITMTNAPPHDSFGNLHITTEWGMMNTQWGFLDRYSAVVLDRMAGERARMGNFNEPWDMGDFLNDLPARNRIFLKDSFGRTFPGRTVRIYSTSSRIDPGWEESPYRMLIDGTPELTLTTDAEGAVEVGRNPFSDGELFARVDQTNVMAIVQLVDGTFSRWGYLEAWKFNLAYWRGETEQAVHTLVLDAPICGSAGLGSHIVTPAHEALVTSRNVKFQWLGNPGRTYELWWSIDGGEPSHVTVDAVTAQISVTTTIPTDGHVAWWYVDTEHSSDGYCPTRARSGIYHFDLAAGEGGEGRRRPARR